MRQQGQQLLRRATGPGPIGLRSVFRRETEEDLRALTNEELDIRLRHLRTILDQHTTTGSRMSTDDVHKLLRLEKLTTVRAVAGFVDGFESSIRHPYSLHDVILCKFNATNRKHPHRNTKWVPPGDLHEHLQLAGIRVRYPYGFKMWSFYLQWYWFKRHQPRNYRWMQRNLPDMVRLFDTVKR